MHLMKIAKEGYFFSIIFISFFISAAYGAESSRVFKVKYISSGNVYIDGGTADSLAVGDSLKVIRGDSVIADLLVSFAAEHSSSCTVIDKLTDIQVGDIVQAELKAEIEKTPEKAPEVMSQKQEETKQDVLPAQKTEKNPAHIRGRVAFTYFAWKDLQNNGLNFRRPGLELNLAALNLWGSGYSLNIRTSTRYNQREKRYSNNVAKNEFRNRVYEFSINNGSDRSMGVTFGRIIPRDMSGVGYIDGVMVSRKISNAVKVGGFGGSQPQWQYADPQMALQKYGLFATATKEHYHGMRLESTLATVGEYHSFNVSREFTFVRNMIQSDRGFYLYQSAEIDLNRSWRRNKTNEMIALTSFYLSGRYRLSPRVNAGIGFDTRKRYWNYEQKSLADSLFDGLSRRNLTASLDFRLPADFSLATNVGIRSRQHFSEKALSYSLNVMKFNLTPIDIRLGVTASGFTGQYADGLRLSYDVGKYTRRGDYLALGYGLYRYTYKSIDSIRSSRWLEGKWIVPISRQIVFSGDLQRSFGNDINGLTAMADIGYNFR